MAITAKITKVEDIPYAGDTYIEGFRKTGSNEIESWSGTPNGPSDDDSDDPRYFRAEWRLSDDGEHGEYKEY